VMPNVLNNPNVTNAAGLFDIIQKGGIIEPPRPRNEYDVDEIRNLSDQSESTTTACLWNLACNVVYDAVAKDARDKEDASKNGSSSKKKKSKNNESTTGKAMAKSDRMLLYFTHMEETIRNYPIRSDGAAVLRYFYVDDEENPAWPPDLIEHWDTIKAKCRADLTKWKNQQNCVLNNVEKKLFVYDLQVRVYVGFTIEKEAARTKTFANNFANRQWPEKFKSGESPSALLQVIRRYYYVTEEAKRLSDNALKQWVSNQKKANNPITKQQIANKLKQLMGDKVFEIGWYPQEW
jgi:hypothetical protein